VSPKGSSSIARCSFIPIACPAGASTCIVILSIVSPFSVTAKINSMHCCIVHATPTIIIHIFAIFASNHFHHISGGELAYNRMKPINHSQRRSAFSLSCGSQKRAYRFTLYVFSHYQPAPFSAHRAQQLS
jgi:hypothetical protein